MCYSPGEATDKASSSLLDIFMDMILARYYVLLFGKTIQGSEKSGKLLKVNDHAQQYGVRQGYIELQLNLVCNDHLYNKIYCLRFIQ